SGSPLAADAPPQASLRSELPIEWQRTRRVIDYMLEPDVALSRDATLDSFLTEVPAGKVAHLLILFPSGRPLERALDGVSRRDGRVLVWLPAPLQAQDVDELRRSIALVQLYGTYRARLQAGPVPGPVRRKLDLLAEDLGLSSSIGP